MSFYDMRLQAMKGIFLLMRRASFGIALLSLLGLFAGCNNGKDGKVDARIADKPIKTVALVEAERPARRDISEYLSETSRITAESQVEVLAKGTGHCLAVNVEEGDMVKKGQVLAELDRDEMEAQVRQSTVNAAQQKIAYERADGGVKQGIVSLAERDNAKFSYEQAKASLEMQEVQLSFLSIRAPIDGVVTKRSLQEGMLVSSGMASFTIVDPASYVLPINVNERHLPRLRIGQEAYVTIDSAGDQEFLARVRRINPGVDMQNSAVKVILDFDKKDHKYLREAAFARYRLVMETREGVLAVPKDAIIEDNTRRYVMLLKAPTEESVPEEAPTDGEVTADAEATPDDTTATEAKPKWVTARTEIEVGLEDSDYTEIVSGVGADDLVITLGQQTVNDGDPVKISTIEEALQETSTVDAEAALSSAQESEDSGKKKGSGRHKL